VLVGLVLLALDAGCMCCSTTDPFDQVRRGDPDGVDFEEFAPPACYSCNLKIDVINSHRQAVRVLFDDDADLLPAGPVHWDLMDGNGEFVPEDVYVIRAWQDNERYDSWVVLVTD